MDLYRGQYDFTNFSTQVHDFDPGINPYPGGLFWTLPDAKINSIDLEAGTAHMHMDDVALRDFFNIPNALFRFMTPASIAAKCSFDIRWLGPVTGTGGVSTPGSKGTLVTSQATMHWTAINEAGFHFVSDPSGTTNVFAQLGHISNGVFAE